jgi:hypothetical protein
MPSSTFSYTSADGTRIAAYRWDQVLAELASWLDRVVAGAGPALASSLSVPPALPG